MRLKILGTQGNIPLSAPRYSRHSGILVDTRILLDLGEPAYLRYRPRRIFITHLHPDHAAFLQTAVETDAAMGGVIAAAIRQIASLGDGVRTSAARDGLVIDI